MKWQFTFDKHNNAYNQVFWTDHRKSGVLSKDVTLMVQSEGIYYLRLYETANFRFLKVPFKKNYNAKDKNDYYLLIALPISNSSLTYTEFNQAAQLLANQNSGLYWAYFESKYPDMSDVEYRVQLFLPKMTLKGDTIKLDHNLKSLGMTAPFENSSANFEEFKHPNTDPDLRLWINAVYHKTFFEMTEKGVEAAAVTVVETRGMMFGGSLMVPPPKPIKYIPFRVDHPFYFSVLAEEMVHQEAAQKMLFLGKVNCIGENKCTEIEYDPSTTRQIYRTTLDEPIPQLV